MRSLLSFVLVAVGGSLSSGCLVLGAAPPGRADIGPALLTTDGKSLTAVRFTVGAHVASATKKLLPYDVGVGYVLKSGDSKPPNPEVPKDNPPAVLYHGGYLEGAYGFQLGPEEWSRSWVGLRGELDHRGGWGLIGRWAWESSMFVQHEGGSSGNRGGGVGTAYGRLGYGFFLEGGYESLPAVVRDGRLEAVVVSAGITLRFPAFAFAGLFL